MELLAVTSQSARQGALIMMGFTLGTVPAFLVIGVAATQFGRRAYPVFRPVAAVIVAVIGVITSVSGARLLGWGLPSSNSAARTAGSPVVSTAAVPSTSGTGDQPPQAAGAAGAISALTEATLYVNTGAFEPAKLTIPANVPVRLNLVTSGTRGCIRAFVIPSLGIELLLPETGTQQVELPPSAPGETIPFMCSMGMFRGQIEVVGS
jgi:heme/copper-type cytochrome/quinol oxidase subunit 2